MDYSDNEPHTATAAAHIEQLANDLREFCATHNRAQDYADAGDFIQELGATLNALYDRNDSDIITLCWSGWSGFILKDEEEYNIMDYSDNEPHTATAAAHIEQLANDLREFCATHNRAQDYADAGDFIQELGATLNALYDRNDSDIITLCWADWSGFILKDEEE